MKAWIPAAALSLVACGANAPTRDAVRSDFEQWMPNASVTRVRVLGTNGRDAVLRIEYQFGTDSLRSQQWFYQQSEDGRWAVTHRDTTGQSGWLIPARPNQRLQLPGATTK